MSNFKYIFGPVPSRRLGISLGVDLVPLKRCTYNCVYCECGPTKTYHTDRKEYVRIDSVIEDLKKYMAEEPDLDYITFSGGGEPTLNSGIGKVIKFLKKDFPDYDVALLTNGSLLYRADVIDDVKNCDLIIPSLDAVSEDIFKKINSPCEGFTAERVIEGIKKLKKNSTAKIWVEVFIVPKLNDSDTELKLIKETLLDIEPDKVQLNCLDRPGTKQWVKALSEERLNNIAEKFSPLPVEIIGKYQSGRANPDSKKDKLKENILNLLSRRPCTVEDIANSFGIDTATAKRNLRKLKNSDRITEQKKERGVFYTTNESKKTKKRK